MNSLCSGREEAIHQFLDDELSPTDREEFLGHLEQCVSCQTLLNELQIIFAELESLEDIAEPADIVGQVMQRLPQPAASPTRLTLGWLALSLQIAVGLASLLLAGSMLLPTVSAQLVWRPWAEAATRAVSLTEWLSRLFLSWGQQLQTWLNNVSSFNLDLSSGVILMLIAVLLMAWFIGNSLLLHRYLSTSKNGGAV